MSGRCARREDARQARHVEAKYQFTMMRAAVDSEEPSPQAVKELQDRENLWRHYYHEASSEGFSHVEAVAWANKNAL